MAGRAKENLPGGSVKYLFVYLKVRMFKCSYRIFIQIIHGPNIFNFLDPRERSSGPAFFWPRQAVVKDIFEGLRLKQEPGLVTWGIEYPLRIFFVDHLVNLGGFMGEVPPNGKSKWGLYSSKISFYYPIKCVYVKFWTAAFPDTRSETGRWNG